MTERRVATGWRMIERHIQTGVSSLILVAVVWGFSSMQKLQIEMANMRGEIAVLSLKIENLSWRIDEASKDRYTGTEAVELKRRVAVIEDWISKQ